MPTSAGSSQPEGASLERCFSASSAHGTARTEAQRLGLLASLATSNMKRSLGCLLRAPLAALLRKCERLQITRSQKGLAWKAVSHPRLRMALLALRHRDWGCLLDLAPPTSNITWEWDWVPARLLSQPCSKKCERLQIAGRKKGLAWKAVAQPHLHMALLAQRHRDWGCLLILPPQTSNAAQVVHYGRLRKPCSKNANVSR